MNDEELALWREKEETVRKNKSHDWKFMLDSRAGRNVLRTIFTMTTYGQSAYCGGNPERTMENAVKQDVGAAMARLLTEGDKEWEMVLLKTQRIDTHG